MRNNLPRQPLQRPKEEDAHPVLSERQSQIVARIGDGKTNKEIAVDLHLSPETISSYRKGIRQKLNLHSTAALAAYSVQARLRAVEVDSEIPLRRGIDHPLRSE